MDKLTPKDQLALANTNLFFLLLVIASVLLSYLAALRQREAIFLTFQGDGERAAQVGEGYPLRKGAGALMTSSLGYFLCLAIFLARHSDTDIARRSAQANLLASVLVLAASVVRFRDLNQSCAEIFAQETGILTDTKFKD